MIVNDLGSLNIDGRAVKKMGLDENNEKVVELSNGCMCCGLKDDLLKEIADIARSGKYDVLLVEGSGVAEPMPVAEGISNFDIGRGKTLSDIVHLDTVVTVIDTPNFLQNYNSQQSIGDRPDLDDTGKDLKEVRTPVVSLMVEQIEFANVVVLNKKSEVPQNDLANAMGIVTSLNPGAKLVCTDFSKMCPTNVLCTNLFDFNTAEEMPGWALLQDPTWVPKVAAADIRHVLYKRDKPFHPGRLTTLLADHASILRKLGLVRSKGVFWLATRSEILGEWQHAGCLFRFVQGAPWGRPKSGTRRQELVLIGPGLDTAEIMNKLDKCLLTEEEMAQKHLRRVFALDIGADDESSSFNWWQALDDKFPVFEVDCCEDSQGFRFPIGTRVECNTGDWLVGTVVGLNCECATDSFVVKFNQQLSKNSVAIVDREDTWPAGQTVPYQIRLDINGGHLIYAPMDQDDVIRRASFRAVAEPETSSAAGHTEECQ